MLRYIIESYGKKHVISVYKIENTSENVEVAFLVGYIKDRYNLKKIAWFKQRADKFDTPEEARAYVPYPQ